MPYATVRFYTFISLIFFLGAFILHFFLLYHKEIFYGIKFIKLKSVRLYV